MTILLAIAILALIALVVYRDLLWEQRVTNLQLELREERGRAQARYVSLQAEVAEERAAAFVERKELYQRIQAPEVAVAEAHRERRGPYVPRKPVGADDDAAYARGRADKSDVKNG